MPSTTRGFTYPSPTAAPDVPTDMQALAQSIDNYFGTLSTYACFVYQTAVTSLPNNTATTVLFDTEFFDPAGMHSTSSNTGRITAPVDGLYSVHAMVAIATSATGYRDLVVQRNGTAYLRDRGPAISGISTIARCSGLIPLTAGQYLEMQATQNSGGALDTVTGVSWTKLIVNRVGDLV